ncbi:MAG: hypothetical protein VB055_09790 [Oscillospiraceae bacterium]|nr:hypothetical protein [Oscillospiraceae bacterium]
MRIKRIASVALCCVLLALTGCQLAKENGDTQTGSDQLIGVLVTTEYLDLFDLDGYVGDNASSFSGGEITLDGTDPAYQGRLYASIAADPQTGETGETTDPQEYVFDGIDGIAYFAAEYSTGEDSYTGTSTGEGISDAKTAVNIGDEENTTTLEGTIYVNPRLSGMEYYVNPIYQSGDGSVYTVSGSGFSFAGVSDEGNVYSQELSHTATVTEDGESKTDSVTVKISFATMFAPEQITVLQMDQNSTVLSREEYQPGTLPDCLTLPSDVAYVVVETDRHNAAGEQVAARSLCNRGDDALETFYCREDGVCVKYSTQLTWE